MNRHQRISQTVFLAVIFSLVGSIDGEPVKWADGSVSEVIGCKLRPFMIEIATDTGKELIEFKELDFNWVKTKFPENQEVVLRVRVEQIEEALDASNAAQQKLEKLSKDLQRLEAEVQAIETENGL